ncbi:hypothetical protein [Curtobacterium sp. MCBD17_021]|uniref:hypothetical protein n=1 Tax=Curtobacterium sp. MCBD17_021 TaxID=2175665 RepID=UPI0015E89FA2|nr:hypothetical protein [Curtobacterium sp. MCBD17_021]
MGSDQMFALVVEGILEGFGTMSAAAWRYSVAEVWPFAVLLGVIALKLIELRARRRPRR